MRANERAGVGTFRVRKGDENFAKYSSIFLRHNAEASYTCRIATVFNRTRLNKRKPISVCVESPDDSPRLLRGRVNDAAQKNARHP